MKKTMRTAMAAALMCCCCVGVHATQVTLTNPKFDNSDGWTGSFDRHSRSGNTIAYRYGMNLLCQQSLPNAQSGLYRLSANACALERYDSRDYAIAHAGDPIPTRLFVGKYDKPLPQAFTEKSADDYGWCWEMDGGYVPYYVDGLTTAFDRGMYKCFVYGFYEPDETNTLTIGVRCTATEDVSRWAAWDNMELTFYSEAEVNALVDSVLTEANRWLFRRGEATVMQQLQSLMTRARTATTYRDKAEAFADIMYYEPTVQVSQANYALLLEKTGQLSKAINAAGATTSPATVEEALALWATTAVNHSEGTLTNEQVATTVAQIDKMLERLAYLYLDITVNTPGSLGDSILSRVEYFTDVKSLKLSGTVDNADISTLQGRLTELREIDMTDLQMTDMPYRLFYQRATLETAKLPRQLETIGEQAFYECTRLQDVAMPTTLNTIGRYAFYRCRAMQSVVLPEGLTTLDEGAFSECSGVQRLQLPSTLSVINNYTFYYNSSLVQVDFAEGLTRIEHYAFQNCTSLPTLKFPSTLLYIGSNAFSYNRSLTHIEFNEGLYQIRDNAFYDCDGLTEVTLPSSLVLANESPFDYCDNLVKVTCLSIEPPYMTDQIPYGLSMEGRELYVPALSLNIYKQTTGWDRFPTIKPIDHLPDNFTVLTDMHLTLPESIPADYKPNVSLIHDLKGGYYYNYGRLTVNGAGTLSMNSFSMIWDQNYQYNYSDRTSNYCTLVNNSHLRADNVSIEMYTPNNRWSFISLPFDVKMSDIDLLSDGTTNYVVRRYDGQKRAAGETADTWVRLTADDTMEAGQGYIIQGSRYVDNNYQNYSGFRMKAVNNGNKNDIFASDDVTVALNEYPAEHAHNRSWNLVGNPYPSYYDTRFMQFDAPITVWNIRNNTYVAYSPADDDYILCPGEAFFVQRPVETAGIVFGKDGRQSDRTVRSIAASRGGEGKRLKVNLTLSGEGSTDRTRVVLNEEASAQYELERDAAKFMSTDALAPQLYTTADGVDYAINERPVADGRVELSARFGSDGIYTIALDGTAGCTVALEDLTEGRTTDLTEGGAYVFTATKGTCKGRFVLRLGTDVNGIVTVEGTRQADATTYDLQGRKVSRRPAEGIYIQNGKKVIVNK